MMPELQLRAMVSIVAPKFNFRLKPPLKFFCASSSSTSIEYPPPHNHPQWSGLHHWRRSPINDHRYWGHNGPIQEPHGTETDPHSFPAFSALDSCASLAEMDVVVLSTANPLTKAKRFHLAYAKWRQKGLPVGVSDAPLAPARPIPIKPLLVSPKAIPPPKSSGLPLNGTWIQLVIDQTREIMTLAISLNIDYMFLSSSSYGDMPAHSFLWRECEKSSGDVAARLAVIPLVQEARGLDAGPQLVKKLIGFGDHRTSDIVAKIANEEVARVAVGVYWFVSVCQRMGRVPSSTFKDILDEYNVELKGPFNHSAREEAGIPQEWYTTGFLT